MTRTSTPTSPQTVHETPAPVRRGGLDLSAFPELATATPFEPGTRDKTERRLARTSLARYAARLMPDYDLYAGEYTRRLAAILERVIATPNARVILAMPPRHSKSFHVSENLPGMFLGQHPDGRVIGTAWGLDLARTFSRLVRGRVQAPEYPFPGVTLAADSRRVTQWDLAGSRGGYYAVGRGGSPVGFGADLLIVDDPYKGRDEANSAELREKVWRWYTSQLRTRLQPGGRIIVTATRWHTDDLTGRLLAAAKQGGEQWEYIQLPAIVTDPDTGEEAPIWPEFWSLADLQAVRSTLPDEEWQSQYMGAPVAPSGGMLKREWVRFWQFPGMNLPPVQVPVERRADPSSLVGGSRADRQSAGKPTYEAHPVLDLPPFWVKQWQSWDLNFHRTTAGSFAVGLAMGLGDGRVWLLDEIRDRFSFTEAQDAMRLMSREYPLTDAKLVEYKANGPAIIDQLSSEMPGLTPVEPDGSKEARAFAMTSPLRAGGLVLPHPDLEGYEWVNDFLKEMAEFPYGEANDRVDALSQGVRYGLDTATQLLQVGGDLGAFLGGQLR